jgi:hypothetical protein
VNGLFLAYGNIAVIGLQVIIEYKEQWRSKTDCHKHCNNLVKIDLVATAASILEDGCCNFGSNLSMHIHSVSLSYTIPT